MAKPPKDKMFVVPTAEEIATELAPKSETTLDRIYRENNVTAKQIAQQPKMTKALGHLGGLDVAAEYLRGCEDPEAVKFIEVYDSVFEVRDFLEYEGICAAAGVSGKKLFGIIAAEAAVDSEYAVSIITSVKMPEVVAMTAELAMLPQGHRERTLMAKASGYLPKPKGSQTNIQINNANAGGRQGGGPNMQLPPFDQDIRELGERFQAMNADKEPKLLEGKV
jgi:hypothetical protein